MYISSNDLEWVKTIRKNQTAKLIKRFKDVVKELPFTRTKRKATDSKFNLGRCTDPQYDFLVYRASKKGL